MYYSLLKTLVPVLLCVAPIPDQSQPGKHPDSVAALFASGFMATNNDAQQVKHANWRLHMSMFNSESMGLVEPGLLFEMFGQFLAVLQDDKAIFSGEVIQGPTGSGI